MITDAQEKLIDRYIEGDLSQEELSDFETLLEFNVAVKERTNLELNLRSVLADQDVLEFRKVVSDVMENGQNIENSRPRWIYYISVAAAVLILAFVVFFPESNKSERINELVNEYYTPYPNLLTSRSFESEFLDKFSNYYQNKSFKSVIDLANDYDGDNSLIYLYLAISHYELANYNEATKSLDLGLSISDRDQRNVFIWYKSLCLIQLKDIEEASILLEELIMKESVYQEMAEQLIQVLPQTKE